MMNQNEANSRTLKAANMTYYNSINEAIKENEDDISDESINDRISMSYEYKH